MKYRMLLGFILFTQANVSNAADTLCLQKEQGIQHEIGLAKKHNNQRRVNGLQRALSETKADCTDKKLQVQHQQKIVSQQHKLAERQKELDKEKADGVDKNKIAKRERKLQEAKSELKKAKAAPF